MNERIVTSLSEHCDLFSNLGILTPEIEDAIRLIVLTLRSGNKVLICGNGGSAADAQHFAAELVGKFEIENRRAFSVIALNGNSSSLTAIGNDIGYGAIFARQIFAYGKANDLLIAITTSGTSTNILTAIGQAQILGMRIIILCGQKGIGRVADCKIIIPHNRTARIQEAHEFILHCIAESVEWELA